LFSALASLNRRFFWPKTRPFFPQSLLLKFLFYFLYMQSGEFSKAHFLSWAFCWLS